MAELSKRLQAVADLVTPGMRLADVGTDHAYIPIYLTQNGLVPSAIAMDINKGPLERADTHILEHGLDGKIVTRLSDGLVNLKMEEADTMIAAGMGGGLVIHILNEDPAKTRSLKELVLQRGRGYGRRGWQILSDDEGDPDRAERSLCGRCSGSRRRA